MVGVQGNLNSDFSLHHLLRERMNALVNGLIDCDSAIKAVLCKALT